MTEHDPARGPEQRRQDVTDRFEQEHDAWVTTASADDLPRLAPLSFVRGRGRDTLLPATRRTNPTAVDVTPSGQVRVALGHTRDVVLVEATAEIVEGAGLPADSGDALAVKLGRDPRDRPARVYLGIAPSAVGAWREENELAGREVMVDGTWPVRRPAPAPHRRPAAHERPSARSPAPAPVTAMAPSVSVRRTSAPPALSVSRVVAAGCP